MRVVDYRTSAHHQPRLFQVSGCAPLMASMRSTLAVRVQGHATITLTAPNGSQYTFRASPRDDPHTTRDLLYPIDLSAHQQQGGKLPRTHGGRHPDAKIGGRQIADGAVVSPAGDRAQAALRIRCDLWRTCSPPGVDHGQPRLNEHRLTSYR
jgi:hypothetical protein